MTKNKDCQSKTASIDCTPDSADLFKTTKIWGGRKEIITECLSHAAASENRGQETKAWRNR